MKHSSNLAQRLLTALVGVPLLCFFLFYAAPAWFFGGIILPASMAACWEFLRMTHPSDPFSQSVGVSLGFLVSVAVYWARCEPKLLCSVFLCVPLIGWLLPLLRLGNMATVSLRACALGIAPFLTALPLSLLAVMRRDLVAGSRYVLLALLFAWLSDSTAYFVGRFLGEHKLYEAVSPKKTVEGALGGLVGSICGALLAHFWFLPSMNLSHAVLLACVAGVLGQAGDLAESAIKRSTQVKDSGRLFPGHGGILDRVDALLLTGVTVYLYTLWYQDYPGAL
ncbi:phosphatidate cytidylyltransferase [Pajaroellobacter abortibovis]|uniref:Phosphatidate cytidylyltransferase n=1 Tax=Pajaroellobacter abortibovis TaxID=1882918 RepID=A0A1L6MY59_9BACT|nr:phosphatidate cytidylyltransferase [Pajaroellobacter abortibovis]APS00460.1 hypothetical protein BCY86_07060 [Pajaroellobacter abortibovis]